MTYESYQKEIGDKTETAQVVKVCGMCSYHRIKPLAHCRLRASADLDYITFAADSTHAQQCSFFSQNCPF